MEPIRQTARNALRCLGVLIAGVLFLPRLRAEDPAPAPQKTQDQPSLWPMIAIMGLVFYFMVWRPQRREEKKKKEMLANLKKNDHVVTASGIHGVVANVTDSEVVLKVDESQDVRIKFSRSAVAQIVTGDEEVPAGKK